MLVPERLTDNFSEEPFFKFVILIVAELRFVLALSIVRLLPAILTALPPMTKCVVNPLPELGPFKSSTGAAGVLVGGTAVGGFGVLVGLEVLTGTGVLVGAGCTVFVAVG